MLQQYTKENKRALPLDRFQETLEVCSGKKLKVKINDNRSTMLSVRWESDLTSVSLHRMFLQAPSNVMQALACYLKGENRHLSPTVKAFIEHNVQYLDYSHSLDPNDLHVVGRVYHLQSLYDSLNAEYFNNSLRLLVTWFELPKHKQRNKITLGLYQDPLRLVKINRLLDHLEVPPYLISFVMYHEMLHAVSRPYVDKTGTNRIHSKEFKQLEERFRYYEQAKRWIKVNRGALFDEL